MIFHSFDNRIGKLRDRLPLLIYCKTLNAVNAIRGKRHRVSAAQGDYENGVMLVRDEQASIFFCRRQRANFFKRGVMQRVDALARQYCLDSLDIAPGGLFIDCGANIGELGLWSRTKGLAYAAFEPEEPEALCCDLNNFDGRKETRREALWSKTASLPFFSKPESADSSVFEIEGGVQRGDVAAIALDHALDLSGISGTVVFKVEAEGAEPEVQEGAARSLESIDWVAVDCSYERGREQTHTFVETNSLLHDHGFRLHRANLRRITALYRNTRR